MEAIEHDFCHVSFSSELAQNYLEMWQLQHLHVLFHLNIEEICFANFAKPPQAIT